jgi:Fe-S cluster assembly iron-binding protein IscA
MAASPVGDRRIGTHPIKEASMLTITPGATEAIRGILDQDEVPDGSVIRISPEPEKGLAIALVRAPAPDDHVIETQGIEICVEASTAEVLDDKELDASTSGDNVAFSIAPQGGLASQSES